MEDQVGTFGDQVAAVVFDRGDDRLHRLLAELFGAVPRALVQELARVGRLSAGDRAGINGGGEIVKGETRHQLNSCALNRALVRAFSTFSKGSRQGSRRIGSPARTICSLASRMVNSPKWKIDAAKTAVACPLRMPSTKWSRLPTPPEAITGTWTLSATA